MTNDEFLVWQAAQDRLYELIDGVPVAMAGARFVHDRVAGNVSFSLKSQFRTNGSPCDSFSDDIGVVVGSGRIRRPDVAVHCPPFDEQATASDSPKLIVEILSESTASTDRFVKLEEFKALSSLDYILFVVPDAVDVVFWFRDPAGTWRHEAIRDLDVVIDLPKLEVSLAVTDIYERIPLRKQSVPLVARCGQRSRGPLRLCALLADGRLADTASGAGWSWGSWKPRCPPLTSTSLGRA